MANFYTGKNVMEAINNISTSDDILKDNIYERKYKEALEWMRSVYDGLHGAIKEDAEHYFPELKENENEYIRQRIIHALRGDVLDMEETIKGIAWLEKQKVTDEEIIFRPIAGTDIRIAAKQALEKIDIGKKVVLAFNGAYIPVNGKTVGEIDSEYDAWLKKRDYKTLNVDLLNNVLRKHLYTCVNKTNTYVRSEEDHISLSELINKIRADLIID